MPEQQLNRWIKRIALLLLVGIVAFIAFYAVDRFRAPSAALVDREMAALEEAVRTDPTDVASRGRLADLYYAKQQFPEAITQYTALIEAGKDVDLAQLGRARAYEKTLAFDAAIADYEAVVEARKDGEMAGVDPNLAAAYYGLGTIAIAQDKPQEAIEPLTQSVAIQRTDADALNALGAAYIATGRHQEAIEHLELATALVPVGWADPYRSLETAYVATDKPALAEWAGAMAMLIDGDDATAETRLLALLDGDEALQATLGLALVMETRGDSGAAADWYRKALEIDPENISARLGVTRVQAPVPASHMPIPSPAEGNN